MINRRSAFEFVRSIREGSTVRVITDEHGEPVGFLEANPNYEPRMHYVDGTVVDIKVEDETQISFKSE